MGSYSNMVVCDLRFISTVEAQQITDISNIDLLVLPQDAPEDVKGALAAIPKSNIRQMIYLGMQEELDASKYIRKTTSYKDVNILDLRSLTTVEAAESIQEIKRVKVLIVPSDGPEEVRNAIMAIPQREVGKILRLRLGEEVDYTELEEEISLNERRTPKYENMDILDMRSFKDAESIQKIGSIKNITILVLLADASPEIMSAIASVPKKDISKTIYLKDGEEIPYRIQKANGVFILGTVPQRNTIIKANGICIIPSLPGIREDVVITLKANGLCLIHSSLKDSNNLEISMNGMLCYKNFDSDKIKLMEKMKIDAATLSYLPDGTFLIVGDSLVFEDDVTPEMLIEKKIQILAGNNLSAPKHLIPYLTATATAMNIVEKKGD